MSDLLDRGVIRLFGTIVKDEYIWPEDTGLFSAAMVIDALAQASGDVVLMVNSDGGMPSEGEAIRAALEAHPGKVTVKVTGNAHSAASLMIMAADHIEMSAGSLMLVHDPSIGAFGNAAALTAQAAELDVMADAYAAVYAARAGITPEAAREIMRAETMYSASAAVEAGFADAVTAQAAPEKPAMSLEAARNAAVAAMSRANEARMKFEAAGGAGDPAQEPAPAVDLNPVSDPNLNPGDPADLDKEFSMTKPNPPANPAPANPAPANPAPANPAPVMSAEDAVTAERARVKAIREAGAPFMSSLGADFINNLIDTGATVERANAAIVAQMAAHQRPVSSGITITRDENETRVEGMIGALMHRADRRTPLEGPATDFRGLRLKSLAMTLAGGAGGFNEIDTIKAGLRSTALMGGGLGVSDFSYITTEVMGRTLRAAYERRASTWRRISFERSANDFREMTSIAAGGDFQLKPVAENGEYLQSTITDGASGLKVAKYGRQINLSFEAIVNDDLGVFQRIPGDFARAAATLEASIVWGAIRTNAKTGDGKALFHADHKNTATAGAISVASVGAGRKLMWEQRPEGVAASDKDAFIQVSPDLLYVPPALEVDALQFVTAVAATKGADVNPFGSTLTPVVEPSLGTSAGGSDAAWYLFSSDLPVMEHAYLDGFEVPTVVTKDGMNPDGVNMVARHIFGAAPTEWRGVVKNAGA